MKISKWLGVVAAGALMVPFAARAANPLEEPSLRTIRVMGEGKTGVAPDVALVMLGDETSAKTLAEASERSTAKMTKIIGVVKSHGVAERDIQTRHYDVSVERRFDKNGGNGEITGYRVVNQVQVKVRDLKKVGTLLDQVIAAGASNINGITFTKDDPSAARSQARTAAVASARVKAEELARAAGVKLGDLLLLTEVSGGDATPAPRAMMMKAMDAGGQVPVEVGELEIRVSVQAIYGIR
jgi:uncharacterized protein YggE